MTYDKNLAKLQAALKRIEDETGFDVAVVAAQMAARGRLGDASTLAVLRGVLDAAVKASELEQLMRDLAS